MYTKYPMSNNHSFDTSRMYYAQNGNDERFFWAPFVFGGLAGTALGYGLANNNQINNGPMYYPMYPMGPVYYYPPYSINSSHHYY